jgi:hypothetical protein
MGDRIMKVKQIIKVAEAIDDSRKMPCDMHELEDTKYFSHSKQDFIAIADMDIVHLVRAFKNDRHRLSNQLTDKDLIRQNEDLVSANRQLARQHDIWKEKAMNMVEKSTHKDVQLENQRLVQQLEHDEHNVGSVEELENTLKGTIKANSELIQLNKQLKESLRQVNLTPTVSTQAYDIAWDNNEVLKNKYEELRKTYAVLLEDYNRDTGRGIWKERYEQELENAEYWKNTYYNNQPKGCGYVFSEIPNDTDGQEFVDAMKKYFNKKTYKMRVRGQHIKPELKGTGATYWGQNKDESTHMRVYIDVK